MPYIAPMTGQPVKIPRRRRRLRAMTLLVASGLLLMSVFLAVPQLPTFLPSFLTTQGRAIFDLKVSRSNKSGPQLIEDFQKSSTPRAQISLGDIPQFIHDSDLIRPSSSLPKTHKYPIKAIREIYGYSQSCRETDIPTLDSRDDGHAALRKTLEWHRFLCDKAFTLPPEFFQTPPYIHPDGESFVFKAFRSKDSQNSRRTPESHGSWRELTSYAHIIEMTQILPSWTLPIKMEKANLSPIQPTNEALESMASTNRVIIDRQALYVRRPDQVWGKGSAKPIYDQYSRASFQQFLAKQGFTASRKKPRQSCSTLAPGYCLGLSKAAMQRHTLLYRGGIAALVLFSLALLGYGIAARRRFLIQQKLARDFILQTLVHELRTPLATQKFTLETFRDHFDELPDKLQDAFLQLCDNTTQLVDLVEASELYLRRNQSQKDRMTIHSINEFVGSVVQNQQRSWIKETQIDFRPSTEDRAIPVHPYWLSLCLRNLVENAVRHGKGPVEVWIKHHGDCDSKKTVICVSDSGRLPWFWHLKHRLGFLKKTSRAGMGIGLHLVETIVEKIGGTLRTHRKPTRFELVL